MNLTFKGFLGAYCRQLTGLETTSLKRLCAAAATDAPRAAEPLFLLAAEEGRLPCLLKASRGTRLEEPYARAAQLLAEAGSVEHLLACEEAPERLRRVREAYEAARSGTQADRRISLLMRDKALAAMAEKGLTAYRIAKDLGLNLGNTYAFLGKGDATKVSLATARRIMERACG